MAIFFGIAILWVNEWLNFGGWRMEKISEVFVWCLKGVFEFQEDFVADYVEVLVNLRENYWKF